MAVSFLCLIRLALMDYDLFTVILKNSAIHSRQLIFPVNTEFAMNLPEDSFFHFTRSS